MPVSSTVLVVVLVVTVTVTLAAPTPESRVRFPDERSDDGRTGRILLPPATGPLPPVADPAPERALQVRRGANPVVLIIPRDPLPLADPDQYLNSWQFYYPPGPAPEVQLDAAGSDAQAATVTPDSRPSPVYISTPAPREAPQQSATEQSQETTTTETNAEEQFVPTVSTSLSPPEPTRTQDSTKSNLEEQPAKPVEPQQPASNPKVEDSKQGDKPAPVESHAPLRASNHREEQEDSQPAASSAPLPAQRPREFNPQFEDGGWTPINLPLP